MNILGIIRWLWRFYLLHLNCCKDNQKKISLLVSFCLASPARTQFGTAAGTVDLFSLQKPCTVWTPFLTCSVSVCSKIRSVLYAYAVALCHRCTKIQFYLLVWFFDHFVLRILGESKFSLFFLENEKDMKKNINSKKMRWRIEPQNNGNWPFECRDGGWRQTKIYS